MGFTDRQGDSGPPWHLQATLNFAEPTSLSTGDQCVFPPPAPPLSNLQRGTAGAGSTYSMGNQSPHRCFTVSMSSWQRRRRLTSLRALDGTTSVIHTCREGGSVRSVAKPRHQPTDPIMAPSLTPPPPNL